MRIRFIAFSVLLVACSDPEAAPPRPRPAPPPVEPQLAPAPALQPIARAERSGAHIGRAIDREAAATARSGTDTRERSRQVREGLRDARRASRASDFAAALPLFEQVLALAPSDERLMCETAYVALRAGDLRRAAHHAQKALQRFGSPQEVTESNRVPLAMCLYNVGRIEEARQKPNIARQRYEASLALRENRVVRERLTAVGGADRDVPQEPATRTIEELLETLAEELCEELDAAEDGEGNECRRALGDRASATDASSGFREAALLEVTTGDYQSEHYVYLAVRGRDGWRIAGMLLYVYNPGAFGISEEGSVSDLAFAQLIPDGPQELRIDVAHSRSDTDMGIDEVESSQTEGTVICGFVEDRIRCSSLPRVHSNVRECLGMGDDVEGIEPCSDELPIEERYTLAHEIDADHGRITIRTVEGEMPMQVRRWQGTHAIADVLLADDLRLRE